MRIAARKHRLGLRVLGFVLGPRSAEKPLDVPRIAEERIAELRELVRYFSLPLDARFCPDAIIVRRGDDQYVVKKIRIAPVGINQSVADVLTRRRGRLEVCRTREFAGLDITV